MISRTYHAGNSTITLRFDDITTSKAQVLVSSDDFWLSMGGGVSRAILLAGGDQIATEAGKMAPALLGDVVVTAAGRLPARYIFHAITLAGGRCDLPGDTIVRQTTWKAMQLLPLLGCHSIAFPAIGAGVAGIPYQTVASEMATVLARCLLDTAESYCVELYLLDRSERMSPGDFFMFFEAFAQRTLGVATAQHGTQAVLEPPGAVLGSADAGVVREAERRQQAFNMLRHLDARRNELEALLLRSLSSDEPSPPEMLARIKAQLAQIQDLRQGYQAELAPASPSQAPAGPLSVFLSSTSLDLRSHREALRSVIERLSLKFVGMEEFAPTALAPGDLIRRKVSEASIYVGVLGMRYGCIEPSSGLSMTELEYRQAVASNKEILMFVMGKQAAITRDMVEEDPQGFAKLLDFHGRVMKAHTCSQFIDVPDLASKAETALQEARAKLSA